MISATIGDVDWSSLWSNVKKSAGDLLPDVAKAVQKTVEDKAVAAVQPTVQAQVEQKASRVVNKGNIALTAAIGGGAGLLIAGGSWQRKAVGLGIGAILGGLAGLKIGLVGDVE
jgi:hypothetical protein